MSNKFDLVTHRRNKKGVIIEVNPYRLYIQGNVWKYERPPGSGNMYSGAGDLMEGPIWDEQKNAKAKAKVKDEVLEKLVADVQKEEILPKFLESADGAIEPSIGKSKGK